MEKNKKIIKLCYLQIAFYVVFLTSLLLHFKRGLDHRAFALLIILTLLGCASALLRIPLGGAHIKTQSRITSETTFQLPYAGIIPFR